MPLQSTYKTFKTIAKMKAATGFVADELVYVSEIGREGLWYYDAADTTTAENTGIVIVTTTGSLRLKRRLEGDFISKRWFSGSNIYFNDISDANTVIPVASRFRGMMLYILVSSVLTPYWYRDGTADINLVELANILTVSNGTSALDRAQIASAPDSTTLAVKSLGITGVGGIGVTRTPTSTTEDWVIDGLSKTGTYSQRPVSPVEGQEFNQTDLLSGTYKWNGTEWNFGVDDNTEVWCKFFGNVYPMNGNVSGTGASHHQDNTQGFSYWRMNTGTDAAGYAQIVSSQNTVFGPSTGKTLFAMSNVILLNLSDGTNRFTVRVGRNVNDGIGFYFRYSDNLGSGVWQCVTHNGTTSTTFNSSVTVAANTPYRLIAVHDFTGTPNVKFYIDDVLITTITTTLPADFNNGYFGSISIQKGLGTTSRSLLIDDLIIKRVI